MTGLLEALDRVPPAFELLFAVLVLGMAYTSERPTPQSRRVAR